MKLKDRIQVLENCDMKFFVGRKGTIVHIYERSMLPIIVKFDCLPDEYSFFKDELKLINDQYSYTDGE